MTESPAGDAQPTPASSAHTRRALEALLKLNRAVQRATVYPDGHPSVANAVSLLGRSMHGLLEENPTLSLGVTSEGFLVENQPLDASAEHLAWLARRLYEQGVGALTFGRKLDDVDLATLTGWLARKGVATEPPTLQHVVVTLVDYGRARFDEQRRDPDGNDDDPVLIWRALLDGLTAGWYQGDASVLPDDPEACAAALSAEIERNEGVGAASFLAGVIGTGARLPQLGEPARHAVRARLAAFISALAPELRHQLLHVDPTCSARKLDLLADMAEALPDTALMEILADLSGRGERISDSFLGLLNKLVGLSVRDADLRELTETKLVSIGLPRGLTLMDPVHVRAMLEQSLRHRRDAEWTPADYQGTLDRLSDPATPAMRPWSRYTDVAAAEAVSAHVADIVLRLLVALPDHPDAPAYLRRLASEAPRALAEGRYTQLYETASSLRDLLVLRRYVPAEVPQLIEDYLAFLRQPATARALLSALENSSSPPPAALAGLFRLASPDIAELALERIGQLTPGEAREQLADLLARLKSEVFAEIVARARASAGPRLDGLFILLARSATPGRLDCAQTFVGNRDPAVRLRALAILLNADERPAQRERLLQRALTDPAPAVREFAIDVARRSGDTAATTALRAFLLKRGGSVADENARLRAVAVLADLASPEARTALQALLHSRRLVLRLSEVRLCRAAATMLEPVEDDHLQAAVRAWRRSPSGWMAWLFSSASAEPEIHP